MDDYSFLTSVEVIPGLNGKAAFTINTAEVFRESGDITPVHVADGMDYMPWGEDNEMPFRVMDLIEKDETLSTCQLFNAEVMYGAGLIYDTTEAGEKVKASVEDYLMDNDLPTYFLGVCQDFKHFAFCVSVIILSNDGKKIVRLVRKEACYCRFAPADKNGKIPYLLYANWRFTVQKEDIEKITLLDVHAPWTDLAKQMANPKNKTRKYAILTRVPCPDSTYYPIPYYGSLFRGNWYNIKQLIGMGKEAKLKNSAPIKYHIEVADRFWAGIFKREGITDRTKQIERVKKEKQQIIDFITGTENSGKVLFSTYYVNPNGEEQHEVMITKIEQNKEGGDWSTDIIEAVTMICFTMRVHSNLVGSVPGKSQTNNSGSDKRELYTIAQALQKPYHDLLFRVHQIIIRYNGWTKVKPMCPFVMLTTLDENKDAKLVTQKQSESEE